MAKKTEEREIIIGVTKMQEPKKNKKSKKSKTTQQKAKSKKTEVHKQVNQKQRNTEQDDNKQVSQIKTNQNKKKQNKVHQKSKTDVNQAKRRRAIFILKYGALTILFITLILCTMFSPLFNIKTIQVEGNEKITENEIISLSQIQIEQNTFQLSKSKIKKQIKQNAYIGEVKISRKLPSTLIIQVEEREPAYLLEYAGGYVYVDKQGYLLEISQEKLELPILQGAATGSNDFIVGNRLCIEDLEILSSVAKIIEFSEMNGLASLITRIDIEEPKNIKLIFEQQEKIAYLGDNSNLNTKILTIKAILEREEGKAGEIFVNKDLNKEEPVFRERV